MPMNLDSCITNIELAVETFVVTLSPVTTVSLSVYTFFEAFFMISPEKILFSISGLFHFRFPFLNHNAYYSAYYQIVTTKKSKKA